MIKVGRNDPCPCGSGRKFKKCHLLRQDILVDPTSTVIRAAARILDGKARIAAFKRDYRQQHFGAVRPPISTMFQGKRVVAVGNRLMIHGGWRTFADFLLGVMRQELGKAWWDAELKRPKDSSHEIVRWWRHIRAQSDAANTEKNGLKGIPRDGLTSAYLLLAYDLYVIRHHALLQKRLLKRLRLADQFRGARYELFVTATFVRGNFSISHEDERDSSRRHPEFVAIDPLTGRQFSVEAKARNRIDPKAAGADENPKVRLMSLLRDAAAKRSDKPLITFLELDVPPNTAGSVPKWADVARKDIAELMNDSGTPRLDLVVVTNLPHNYGRPGEPDPNRSALVCRHRDSSVPSEVEKRLAVAIRQYGNLPNAFE